MEGYFYHLDNNNTRIHYFFENGYYTGGGKEFHTINDLCPVIDSVARKIPYGWGCYIIERDTLKVQLISPNGRGKYGKFMVAERWAKIEDNGATLRYFQEKNIDGKVKIIDDVFKFHPCQNKPASTNILMED